MASMRLLSLPDAIQQQIESGKLTAGHARSLVATEYPAEMADQIIKLGLTVREAEELARKNATSPAGPMTIVEKDADTRALEKTLTETLGLHTSIKHKGAAGGSLQIKYKTLDQLDAVIRKLSAKFG